MIEVFAPAKVNLYLYVAALRDDGYHPLESLIVFANVGDRLSVTPVETLSLGVTGPFAGDVPADESNLVLRAVRALSGRVGVDVSGLDISLDKQIPAGAGLGGGSSDAAATLIALAATMPNLPEGVLEKIAASLGSDVPACLAAKPLIAQGRGERLSLVEGLPTLNAVLVHPGRHVSTAGIFCAFDSQPAPPHRPSLDLANLSPNNLIGRLHESANDLTAAAIAVEPMIGEVLATLRAQAETRLARMTGSGSACFALCDDAGAAEALAKRLSLAHPGWWVRACTLGAPPWRMRMGDDNEDSDRGARPDTARGSAGHGPD